MKHTNAKLIDAGFTVLRPGETKQPVIKKCVVSSGHGDTSWVVMERFPSKAARDRRMAELLEDSMTICDSLDHEPTPYWDEEREGVVIPALRKVLFAKCLGEMRWEEAMEAAEKAGGKMPDRKEAKYLAYLVDDINRILKEHGGDPLEGWNWASLEFSATHAWYVYFSSGYLYTNNKYNSNYVRALAAL